MKHLSIIIPMYNVESYIERCLRSLENQDIPKEDYEIICINDGSPDDSRGVVIRIQSEYDNIILIDQVNQGVSLARNKGIDMATGKYILFIDPDDYVDPNSFSRILRTADEKQVQVCFLGFVILYKNGGIDKVVIDDKNKRKVFPGTEAYFISRGKGITDPDRMVGVLFDNKFINHYNLTYLPDVPYLEDGEFIARILCLAERCIVDDEDFYFRTIRSGSATNSRLFNSKSAINGFIKAAVNLRDFRNSMALNPDQKEFMNQPVVKFIILSISSTVRTNNIRMFFYVYSNLKANNFEDLDLRGCNPMYSKLGSIYNKSIFLLYLYLAVTFVSQRLRKGNSGSLTSNARQ